MFYSYFNLRKNHADFIYYYNMFLFSVLVLLLLVFSSMDLLFFYVCFEMILLPFFILIGISSYRKRRIHASYLFFFYTLVGSFLMLFTILNLYSVANTTSIEVLLNNDFSFYRESFLWSLLFISLAIKVPMFPFHIWLPEAHVEAPTEGSVILAGVLLKLGTYGFLRFLFPLFPCATYYFSPVVLLICCLGIFYTTSVTLRQVDVKRVIAYSSVGHMNICMMGLFSFLLFSIQGSIHLMLAHGIVSGGLFFMVGMLYNRFHTKIFKYYGGIIYIMPLFSFFFFFFTIANISFPLLSNFVGEFLIFLGLVYSFNYISLFFCSFGVFFTVVYSIWLYNRVIFLLPSFVEKGFDLNFMEICILTSVLFFVITLGVYPNIIFSFLELSTLYYNWELLFIFG